MRRISESKRWKFAAGVAIALLAVVWMGNQAFAQDAGSGSGGSSAGTEYAPYESTPRASSDAGSGGTIDPQSGFYEYPKAFDAGGGFVPSPDAGVEAGDGGLEITQNIRLRPPTVME